MVSWRLPPNLALAQSLLPTLEQHISQLQHQLIAAASGPVDEIYSRLGLVNGYFFPEGWGNLSVVNLREDIRIMQAWPPPGIKINWRRVDAGVKDGVSYKLYEGHFKTPCVNRIYDALPPESRVGRVQLLVPGGGGRDSVRGGELASLCGGAPAAAIHLAATGDQGFGRRLRLSFPLLREGVCSLVHESPFYGSRRPEAQKGSKLLRVSDLLALGWATIYESMNLLHWLTQEGYDEGGLCMAGLSMGGVHSCMTSALYPHEVATTALLAPRSAAVAYCDGALNAAMAWQPLLKEADEANNEVLQVINTAAQPVDVMREATYALTELELAWEAAATQCGRLTIPDDRPTGIPEPGPMSDIQPHSASSPSSEQQGRGSAVVVPPPEVDVQVLRQQEQRTTAAVEAVEEVADWLRAGGLQTEDNTNNRAHQAHHHTQAWSSPSLTVTHHHASLAHHTAPASQTSHHPAATHIPSHPPMTARTPPPPPPHHATQGDTQQPPAASNSTTGMSFRTLAEVKELNKVVTRIVGGLSEITHLSLTDGNLERKKTIRRLKHVLETYTDITRFPVPRRPDAAIFVAAKHDAYVTEESVRQLSSYWQGSEMRLVTGGHVTAFLMHQDKFRDAIVDSIKRLKRKEHQSEHQPSTAREQQAS